MPNGFGNIFAIPQVDTRSIAASVPKYEPLSGLAALIQAQNAVLRQARAAGGGGAALGPGQYKGVGDPSKGSWERIPGYKDPQWIHGTTPAERAANKEARINEARAAIIQSDPELARQLKGFSELSAPGMREQLNKIRTSGSIARLAPQLGMSEDDTAKLLLDGPEQEIKNREKAIEDAGSIKQAKDTLGEITDTFFASVKALGKSAEEQAAVARQLSAQDTQRVAQNALRDEERRLTQEGRSTTDLWLSNPIDMALAKSGPIVATAIPQLAGGGLGMLVGGPVGAVAGAAAMGGLSSAAYGSGEMLRRAVNDPNLTTPEQQAEAAHKGYYTGAGISGAIGAVPLGPMGAVGALGKRALARSFSAVPPKALGAKLGAEQGAARLAEYAATKEGKKAQEAMIAEMLARQQMERGFVRRYGGSMLGTGVDAATLGVAWQLGHNTAYNWASGENNPLTEGLVEQGAAGGLLGAMFGIKGGWRRNWAPTQNPEARKIYNEWKNQQQGAAGNASETAPPAAASYDITPPSAAEAERIRNAATARNIEEALLTTERSNISRTIENLYYSGAGTPDEISAVANRVYRNNPAAQTDANRAIMQLQQPIENVALQNALKSAELSGLPRIIADAHTNGASLDEIKAAAYKVLRKSPVKLRSVEDTITSIEQATAAANASQGVSTTAPQAAPAAVAPSASQSTPAAVAGANQMTPTPTAAPQAAPTAAQVARAPVTQTPQGVTSGAPQAVPVAPQTPRTTPAAAASMMGSNSPFTAALAAVASGASPAKHSQRVLEQTLALSPLDSIPRTISTLIDYAGHSPARILKAARKVLKTDPQKQMAVVRELAQRMRGTSAEQQVAAGKALRTTLLPTRSAKAAPTASVKEIIKNGKNKASLQKSLEDKLALGETTPAELESIAQNYSEKSWRRKAIHEAISQYRIDRAQTQAVIGSAAPVVNATKKVFGFKEHTDGNTADGRVNEPTPPVAATEQLREGAVDTANPLVDSAEPVNTEAAAPAAADAALAEARVRNPDAQGRRDAGAATPDTRTPEAVAAAPREPESGGAAPVDGERGGGAAAPERATADTGKRSVESEAGAGPSSRGDGADAGGTRPIDSDAYRAESEATRPTTTTDWQAAVGTIPDAEAKLKKIYPKKDYQSALDTATKVMQKKALGEKLTAREKPQYEKLHKAGFPDMEINRQVVEDTVELRNAKGLPTSKEQVVEESPSAAKKRIIDDPNGNLCG